MRLPALVLSVIVCVASPLFAQDGPRYEISAAATFLREPTNANRYGWLGSFGRNVNNWMAFKGEAAGYYSERNLNVHTFLGGPQFTLHRDNAKVSPWAHFLVGAQHDHEFAVPGAPKTYFAMSPGGGVDVSLNSKFGLRFGADYIRGFRSNIDDAENYRVQSGVVFKLK